jgi:hypothetical protein
VGDERAVLVGRGCVTVSDDSDVCGAETAAGTPCQHVTTDDGDPDRCWIDAHNDAPTESGDPGRDFAINESDHDTILDAARKGVSKAGCARAAGVGEASLERYLDAHDQFRGEFTRARARGEQRLVTGPLVDSDDPTDPDMDGHHARFLLSTSFDYVKTEKQEVEMDADHSIDAAEGVTADFVTYDTEDTEDNADE